VASICGMSCSLVAQALLGVVQSKLQSITERDTHDNQKMYIIVNMKVWYDDGGGCVDDDGGGNGDGEAGNGGDDDIKSCNDNTNDNHNEDE